MLFTTADKLDLSESDQELCGSVIGIFKRELDPLFDSSVTPSRVKKLYSRIDHVKRIIGEIHFKQDPEEVLEKRNHECEQFSKHHNQLLHLCNHIEDLKVEGTSIFQCT